MKSIKSQILVGTRFKMKCDVDDAPERRYVNKDILTIVRRT